MTLRPIPHPVDNPCAADYISAALDCDNSQAKAHQTLKVKPGQLFDYPPEGDEFGKLSSISV